MCWDDPTADMVQQNSDDNVFMKSEDEMLSDDTGCKGVVNVLNDDANISLRSVTQGRTNVRGTAMQPSQVTNVRGPCTMSYERGPSGETCVDRESGRLGTTVWIKMTNLRGPNDVTNVRGQVQETELRCKLNPAYFRVKALSQSIVDYFIFFGFIVLLLHTNIVQAYMIWGLILILSFPY